MKCALFKDLVTTQLVVVPLDIGVLLTLESVNNQLRHAQLTLAQLLLTYAPMNSNVSFNPVKSTLIARPICVTPQTVNVKCVPTK